MLCKSCKVVTWLNTTPLDGMRLGEETTVFGVTRGVELCDVGGLEGERGVGFWQETWSGVGAKARERLWGGGWVEVAWDVGDGGKLGETG